jgi:hypothetical protein
LVENTACVFAKRASWTTVKVEKLEVNILKSVEERTVSCGTPEVSPHSADYSPATVTYNFQAVKKDHMSLRNTIGKLYPVVYEAKNHATHSQTPFQRPATAYQSKVLSPVQTLYVLSPLNLGDLSSVFYETQIFH